MQSAYQHQPVLLRESIEHLRLGPGDRVLDGTLGGGGHAEAILAELGPEGCYVGLDLDSAALAAAGERLSASESPAAVHLVHSSFRDLESALEGLGFSEVDAVLLDLGVSSHQLDTRERGFRFAEAEQDPAPLDMRMDTSRGLTAAELLRQATEEEIADWLHLYGELPGARRMARALVDAREEAAIETSADLVRVIRLAKAGGGRKHNPATLVFQALRIAVNDELGALREGLQAAIRCLRPGGRLVVLSYHSLEDRIVKHTLREEAKGCVCPSHVPVCICGRKPRLRVVTRRPIRPGEEEVAENPRARSALLRAAERLQEAA